jgi:hypothetical protein
LAFICLSADKRKSTANITETAFGADPESDGEKKNAAMARGFALRDTIEKSMGIGFLL